MQRFGNGENLRKKAFATIGSRKRVFATIDVIGETGESRCLSSIIEAVTGAKTPSALPEPEKPRSCPS